MRGFDTGKLAVLDDEKILVNGGTDLNEHPIWIEGPHIFKVHDLYYLICAQGGTAENHSEVVFRSKDVWGPYVSYKGNPILTQRDLNPGRDYPITCTGHADFVETQNETWWAVFLGCQPYKPYEKDYYNTGRETFLAPVTWKTSADDTAARHLDDEHAWPTIIPHGEEVSYTYPYPLPRDENFTGIPHGGNFEYTDNFDSDSLDLNWEFLRAPHKKWYSLTEKPDWLAIELRPETCSGRMNPSFIGRRQQHEHSTASTLMDFSPRADNEKAGLVVFQNETHFYYLCKSLEEGHPVIQLYKSTDGTGDGIELLARKKLSSTSGDTKVYLKIHADGGSGYSFYYGFAPDKWNLLEGSLDASFLSTKVAGGFVGCMYALYATSLGKPGLNSAFFDWFKYKGMNEAYRK